MNFIKSLYLSFVHNVDAHVADFQKAAAKLQAATTYHYDQANAHYVASTVLKGKGDAAAKEAARAGRIADKLKELVS